MPPQPLAPAQPAQTGITDKDKTFDGSLNPLTEKIRAKYPGAYDDLDDASLTKMILAKHPQYEDLAAPKLNATIQPVGELRSKQDIMADPNSTFAERLRAGDSDPSGSLNSFEGSYSSGDTGKAAAMTGAGVAVGSALAGPAVFKTLAQAAEAHPVVAKILLKGLEAAGFGAGIKGAEKLLK